MTAGGTDDTWTRVQDLFLQASALDEDQQGKLLRSSEEPHAVIDEVRRMLQADREVAPAIEQHLLASGSKEGVGDTAPGGAGYGPSEGCDAQEWLGRRIGAYRVQSVLGEGGMGQVFEAVRADQQFDQRVAIKVLRRQAVADDDSSRRFALERQLLARLEHPNIGRLLDGGQLDDGTPFLVMQYVEGQPIDRYCDEARLDLTERLRLFVDVCAAVQFAHSHLVIHRDLKPGNILVEPPAEAPTTSRAGRALTDTIRDAAAGRVRLLDFGIAKLLEPEALDVSLLLTQARYRPMTPLYAAPEQFAGETLTTATDVYALGALLFELLTGETPHSTAGSARAFEDRVRNAPPRSLIEALRGHRQTADERAHARGTNPDALRRVLRGDLERILAKALHRDPARRYPTAGDLGADVSRYLRGEAISVRDDTVGYRLRVFYRRNRALSGAIGGSVLALMLLSALLLRQTFVAQRAVERADTESARSRAIASTLIDLFSTADARQGPTGGEIPVNEFLERMEQSADALEADPPLRAELLSALGQIYVGRGESRRALTVFERAARVVRATPSDAGPGPSGVDRLLEIEHRAARAAAVVGEAQSLGSLERSLARHREAYGASDERTLAAAIDLASYQPPTPAITALGRLITETAAALDPENTLVARALRARGEQYAWAGQHDDARRDYAQALVIFERALGVDHPQSLETLGELTASLPMPAGLPRVRELLERQERVFGVDSGPVAETLDTLGVTLVRQGDLEGGAQALQRSWTIQRRVHGETAPSTLNTARNVAILSSILGDYAAGVPLMRVYVENASAARSRGFGEVQLAFLEARADPSRDNLQRCARRIARSLEELDAQRTGSADRYPGDARLYLARLLLADAQPANALVLAEQALDDRLDDEQEDTGRIVQARFFVARAEAALERPGSREGLQDALAQYESWGRHERMEVELAKRQLDQ